MKQLLTLTLLLLFSTLSFAQDSNSYHVTITNNTQKTLGNMTIVNTTGGTLVSPMGACHGNIAPGQSCDIDFSHVGWPGGESLLAMMQFTATNDTGKAATYKISIQNPAIGRQDNPMLIVADNQLNNAVDVPPSQKIENKTLGHWQHQFSAFQLTTL